MKTAPKEIRRNAVQCRICGDVLVSSHTHDFVTCKCGHCSVDGGRDYLKRICCSKDGFIELSEFMGAELPSET